jgi:hypothetical protein
MNKAEQFVPRARKEDLVVQELESEVLVYDLKRHKAHCLNLAAALVWKHCDGKSTVSAVARKVEAELPTTSGEETVLYALGQLSKFQLLDPDEGTAQATSLSTTGQRSSMSRRDFLRKAGVGAAIAVPVIISLSAPTKSYAASCLPTGSACGTPAQCCSELCVGGLCA